MEKLKEQPKMVFEACERFQFAVNENGEPIYCDGQYLDIYPDGETIFLGYRECPAPLI